jgi:hypothetical protein
VPKCKERLDSNDVFILDLGMRLIQWNGKGSNMQERINVGGDFYLFICFLFNIFVITPLPVH